jgi:hypothetical protein
MADIRCPMCGKPNPEEREVCQYCSARLKPVVSAPQGNSDDEWLARTTSDPSAGFPEREDIPEWLKTLRSQHGGDLNAPGPASDGSFQAEPAPQEEFPNWMTQPEQPAAVSNHVDEEPDWLESIRRRSTDASSSDEGPSAPPMPAPAAEPDWLQSFRQTSEPVEASLPPSAPAQHEAVDDWLSRLGEPETLPPAAARAPEALPDWLQEPGEVKPPAAEVPPPALPFMDDPFTSTPVKDEDADWMKSLEPLYPAAPPPTDSIVKPPDAAAQTADFVDFLKKASLNEDSGFSDIDFPPPAPPEPVPAPEMGDDLPGWSTGPAPDWLAALEAKAGSPSPLNLDSAVFSQPAAPSPAPAPEPMSSTDPFVAGALPDWLGELGTAQRGPETGAPPSGADVENQDWIESASLPNWVQALRPVETVASRPSAESGQVSEKHVEDRGPLAGLRGILPSEPTIPTVARAQAVSTHLEISELQATRSQILESLLASEEQAEELAPAPVISSQRIIRLVIAGVMLVALLIPLLSGIQVFPTPSSAPQEVLAAQSSLASVQENSVVLVVADYSPAVNGEMHAAASAALASLMKKGVRLATISTTTTGQALVDQLIAELAPGNDDNLKAYRTVEKVVRLGYLPGGATALASFVADPRTTAPFSVDSEFAWKAPSFLQDISGIPDFSRIVLLTSDANSGQAWIEQVQPKLGEGSSILVIAGAQAAPALRPYVNAHQVGGMIAGIAGGAAFEEQIGKPGAAWVYWDAFQFGTWAAVLIMIVGAVAVSVRPVLAILRRGEGTR